MDFVLENTLADTDFTDRGAVLARLAPGYARLALENIRREFPGDVWHTMNEPGDFPHRPRDRNPSFYGSFDWHSCVEMHWMLVRLMRLVPSCVPIDAISAELTTNFEREKLAVEATFMADPGNAGKQRPYGWGWALALTEEVRLLAEDENTDAGLRQSAQTWLVNLGPLAEVLSRHFIDWLALGPYPVRSGLHPNSAFGISRALPTARRQAAEGAPELLDALQTASLAWFQNDRDYPASYEPSGHDFLSPALTEADLMSRLMSPADFRSWLGDFLPGLAARQPAVLFQPVEVVDASDGQTAHLHGLNLSRAACMIQIAEVLAEDEPRQILLSSSQAHLMAALPHVVGDDYMVEHWLAPYATLCLSI